MRMSENRGKQFESVIRDAFRGVPDTSVIRLPDPTNGYLGIRNISDFIVYNYPYQYFIECKSVHGNRLPFSNITDNQWNGMLEMSKMKGIVAGVICWWIDKDVTAFIPIQTLNIWKTQTEMKSVSPDMCLKDLDVIQISGKKKRIFFEYDMTQFFMDIKDSTLYR